MRFRISVPPPPGSPNPVSGRALYGQGLRLSKWPLFVVKQKVLIAQRACRSNTQKGKHHTPIDRITNNIRETRDIPVEFALRRRPVELNGASRASAPISHLWTIVESEWGRGGARTDSYLQLIILSASKACDSSIERPPHQRLMPLGFFDTRKREVNQPYRREY
jgi:hypothetical protein